MASENCPLGPVRLPEGKVPLDDDLRALQTELDIAAAALDGRSHSGRVHELHRTASTKYHEALAKRGLTP